MRDWLDDFAAGGALPAIEAETWTAELVGEVMIEAVRWAHFTSGPVGPAGFRGASGIFRLQSTLADHLEEGWGLPEIAGDDDPEERRRYVLPTPAKVSAYEAALQWPAVYLVPANAGAAKILNVWVRCKAFKRSFNGAVKHRNTISRGAAYRLRDRGLSLISQGLDRDGVPLVL